MSQLATYTLQITKKRRRAAVLYGTNTKKYTAADRPSKSEANHDE